MLSERENEKIKNQGPNKPDLMGGRGVNRKITQELDGDIKHVINEDVKSAVG